MLRSTFEKTLKANGYLKGDLKGKIDEAAADGVLTESRRKRTQEDIRVLGNDVLHDEWRVVTSEEYEQAHRYAQRILEDVYDDRGSVEAILAAKNRITIGQLASPATPANREEFDLGVVSRRMLKTPLRRLFLKRAFST